MAINAEQVTVTSTAAALNGTETDTVSGMTLTVRNADDTNAVDLGGSDVAAGEGFSLAAGESLTLELSSGDTLYAIAASDTVVHVLRAGV